MKPQLYSLRSQLLRLLGVPTVLVGLLIGALAIAFVYQAIDAEFDSRLAQYAKLLLQLTHHELQEDAERGIVLGKDERDFLHFDDRTLSFRILQDGRLVTESARADIFGDTPAATGFSTHKLANARWRFFSLAEQPTKIVVEVAGNDDVRVDLLLKILTSLFIPGLIFAALILGFVWLGLTHSLRPMNSLARELNQRGSDDLTPLDTPRIAEEISPFLNALNRLLARLDQSLRQEREFTDNAAHELRTPLAAMKTQVQVLLKRMGQTPDCREDLNDLLAAIDRASHLVGQLLAFARLQNTKAAMETVDFSALTEGVLCNMYPLAADRRQQLKAEITPGLKLQGCASSLGILVRNLVDNAIRYTPERGRISVAVAGSADRVVLTVEDSGPGISPDEREKVFNRFYRIKNSPGFGSGLGLAMVKWVAEMHNATVEMTGVTPQGLSIRAAFLAAS